MLLVNLKLFRIFFIGGGFGSEYVQTIHILDTDSPPELIIQSEPLTLRIQVTLTHFLLSDLSLAEPVEIFL